MVIAIDGPAGAGKSTVARLVAQALNLNLLDTGAMYRCVALLAQRNGLCASQGKEAAALAAKASISFRDNAIFLDGEDVSGLIRTPEIGELASALSSFSEVRAILAEQQKAIVRHGNYVLEGRDTTTVIAPNATLKVFLTASMEERAKRRHRELADSIDYDELLQQIVERDHRDYTRKDSPLSIAKDAIVVETFGLTAEEVASKIVAFAQQ